MAQERYFNGRRVVIPGAYSTIASGVNNPPLELDYGKILIIDSGFGAGFGGGSGVSGTLKSGADAIYQFDNVTDYRGFLKGGLGWLIADPLFRPDGSNPGISRVYHVKAAATTPATMTFTPTGGGANGGNIEIQVRDEGLIGNGQTNETRASSTATVGGVIAEGDVFSIVVSGVTLATHTVLAGSTDTQDVIDGLETSMNTLGLGIVVSKTTTTLTFNPQAGLGNTTVTPTTTTTGSATFSATALSGGVDGTKLNKGYAYEFQSGQVDTDKFRLVFNIGTFKGNWTDGISFNEITETDAIQRTLVISDEFSTIQELDAWMDSDSTFNQFFKKSSFTQSGTGEVTAQDLIDISGIQIASGGTETYSSTYLDDIFEQIAELDYSFVLCTDYADNARSAINLKILGHLNDSNTKYDKYMFVGGGEGSAKFALGTPNSSLTIADAYNSDKVVVVHDSILKTSQASPTGLRTFPSLYHAAINLGRLVGKAPQIPLTNKAFNIDGITHKLTISEQTAAIQGGVCATIFKENRRVYANLQGVNSLQNNNFFINNDGTSYSIQLKRIVAQINKEIEVNAEIELLTQEDGVNINTLSPKDVQDWTKGYLQRKTATPIADNLILSYQDVTVERQGDSYYVRYGIYANGEVNKLFFTGFILG